MTGDRLDLLIEVGTEEIPDRFIGEALRETGRRFGELLREAGLEHAAVETDGTPRRLVVVVRGAQARQADRSEQVVGPPASVAFDGEGEPTRAAEGFARKCGVEPAALRRVDTPKGERVAAVREVPGRSLQEVVAAGAPRLFATLPWPKSMRWGDGRHCWVRPVHWVVALAGNEVVDFELFGVRTGRESRGHRTLSPEPVAVASVDGHRDALRAAHVLVGRDERRAIIERGLAEQAAALGGRPVPDAALVALTADLVEWPVVLTGRFPDEYLNLPDVVVRAAMRDHQRFFAVLDAEGDRLLPAFLHVAGQEDPDGTIAANNASVLVARLDDADFYWRKDLERPLQERVPDLGRILFQESLGTYLDKVERMRALADRVVAMPGAVGDVDRDALFQAVELGKTDQTTEMVKEFTALQGTMGGIYLRRAGLPPATCRAVQEHYLPRWLGDELPSSLEGALLSVIDRTDTLVGCFGVGLVPTGSKDPFALRRAAQGLACVLVEAGLELPVPELLAASCAVYEGLSGFERDRIEGELLPYLEGRVRFVLGEAGLPPDEGGQRSFAADELGAVLAASWTSLPDVVRRLRALAAVRGAERRDDLEALSVSFKRVRNIVRDQEPAEVDWSLLAEPAERALGEKLRAAGAAARSSMAAGDYPRALAQLAGLRPEVDRFFDDVLVMAEDARLRRNRIALLQEIERLFLAVADISQIVVPGSD